MTQELIAKLESASEGSDELSAYVIKHFRAPDGEVICSPINGKWCVYTAPGRVLEMGIRDGWYRREGWNVTESIDAALALAERVVPRWGWDFGKPARMGEHGGRPWADCWPPVEDGEVRAFRLGGPRPTPNHTNAETPALAICAALLRASAAEGEGHV